MPASNLDHFLKVASNTGWQLDASGISDASVTSFGLVSATSLPTDTAVILTVDRVDSSGNATPTKMERIIGVMSGTTVTSCVRGTEGTAQAHAAGAVVEIVISKTNINKLMEGILVEHGQDGTHKEPTTGKTTPVDADTFTLFDSAASYVTKKLTWANVKATSKTYFDTLYPSTDGWQPVSVTWTYLSASSVTVPSGAASLYQKGDKVKFTQTTAKYFVISAVTDTTLTFFVSTDHTVANAAISSIYYSHQESPIGFPTTFNYTPTFASSGTQPVLGSSTIAGKFLVKGNVCWYTGKLTVTTGGAWSAGTGTYRFGLPTTSSSQQYRGQGTAFDNGTADYPQLSETQASAAYCILVQCSNGNNVGATVPMTPATGDYYIWTGFFDF